MKGGFFPDSISTDLHVGSATGVMLNLPNVMSKMLALGIPLCEVIRESTTNPATEIGHPELGQIAVGSVADIAVLRVEQGNFGYADLAGGKVDGAERILPEMTIRAATLSSISMHAPRFRGVTVTSSTQPAKRFRVAIDHQPIWRMRNRMIALYWFMRAGRRFRGAGRIAASRAACSRSIVRAAVAS